MTLWTTHRFVVKFKKYDASLWTRSSFSWNFIKTTRRCERHVVLWWNLKNTTRRCKTRCRIGRYRKKRRVVVKRDDVLGEIGWFRKKTTWRCKTTQRFTTRRFLLIFSWKRQKKIRHDVLRFYFFSTTPTLSMFTGY